MQREQQRSGWVILVVILAIAGQTLITDLDEWTPKASHLKKNP